MTPVLAAWVALGGGLGAVARYGVIVMTGRLGGSHPAGVVTVNLVGCGLAGLLVGLLSPAWTHPWHTAGTLVFAGFLGAFTTVSAFTLDILDMLRDGRPGRAVGYLAISLAGCPAAAGLGWWVT